MGHSQEANQSVSCQSVTASQSFEWHFGNLCCWVCRVCLFHWNFYGLYVMFLFYVFFFLNKSNVLGLWCLVSIITWNKRALTTGHVVAVAMVFFGTISNVWKKIINDLKDMGIVMDVWFGVE